MRKIDWTAGSSQEDLKGPAEAVACKTHEGEHGGKAALNGVLIF